MNYMKLYLRANKKRRIKSLMALMGVTPSLIARNYGVRLSTISHVIRGTHKSKRAENAIADALGQSWEKI